MDEPLHVKETESYHRNRQAIWFVFAGIDLAQARSFSRYVKNVKYVNTVFIMDVQLAVKLFCRQPGT